MRYVWLLIFLIFVAIIGVFAFENSDPVPINYLDQSLSVQSDTKQEKSAICGRQRSATRWRLFSSFPSGRISKTVSFAVYFQLARSILTTAAPRWVTSRRGPCSPGR